MISVKKTLVAACAFSLLGLGAAVAQTDPNAAPAAAPAGAMAAPAGDANASGDAMMKKPMMKKHMSKKHMSKKMMKKKAM